MIRKLKDILNTYTDTELEELELWVNSDSKVENIIIDVWAINLITGNAEIKINDAISKESKTN